MTTTADTPTKSLKIGIFTDDFYPYSGGVARSIELQIHELIKMGHQVTLFAPKVFFDPPVGVPYKAMEVIRLPKTASFLCSLRFGKKTVDSLLSEYDFDVVHSQNERGSMFLAGAIARRLNIPHIHTFHSNYAGTHTTTPFLSAINSLTYMLLAPIIMKRVRSDRRPGRVRYPRHLVNSEKSRLAKLDWQSVCRMASYFDAFTSPAQFIVDSIIDASRGKLADRGFVVANGINSVFAKTVRIRPYDDGTVRFLSAGRLDPEKHVERTIKAFAKLNKPNAELYIMGQGSVEFQLRALAHRVVKQGQVVFLGQFNDPERVANEFANADAFVFSSFRFDTQGMVLAEAASAGTPIIYVDDRLKIGVSPDNAILTTPSVTGVYEAMKAIYNDPALRLRMSEAGRKMRKSLTPATMEERFVAVYTRTIHHHQQSV